MFTDAVFGDTSDVHETPLEAVPVMKEIYNSDLDQGKPAPTLASSYRHVMSSVAVIYYFDRLVIRTRRPLTNAEIWRLAECQRGEPIDEPLSREELFGVRLKHNRRQRKLTIWQVTDETLDWLAQHHPDAEVRYVEVTADGLYESPAHRDNADAYLRRHLVRLWQRKDPVHVGRDEWNDATVLDEPTPDATTYLGKRIAIYNDERPRMADHLPHSVNHLEQRFHNRRECVAAGLATVADLAALDHAAFWRSRVRLVRVDPALLGRCFSNLNNGRRRRHTTEADRLDGLARLDRYTSAQELIIDYREFHIDLALVELPLERWFSSRARSLARS
jgi:hypothetical protein